MFASNTSHSAEQPDAQFNYVTMLLPGNGTNGAQNNTFLDASTNNFTITRNGNATQGTFSPYGSNWSNYFSYNATAANYLTSNSLSLSGDFTIEGYVYWDGVGSVPNMFTLGDSFTSTGIEVYLGGGTNWVVYSNNATRITGAAGVKCQWTYIAVTRSGSTVTMYINGVSQGTWTSSATFSGTIRVGAEFYNGTYYSSMSGYISNFRVNNTTAINQVPTAPLTAVSGTIFLTCQSNRFIDNSSNGYTITVNGSPSVQRFSPFAPTAAYSAATIGGSGYFDGSGDSLSAPDNTALEMGSSDFTMEAWLYPNDSGWQTILTKSADTATAEFQFYAYNNAVNFFGSAGSTWNVGFYTGAVLVPKAWNHVAVTRSGSNWTIWVNGVSQATATASFTISNNTSPVVVGAFTNGVNYATGYLTDVRIVKGTAVYTSNFTPPTAPLTAITNTSLLLNFTNAAIFDNAMMNDLETVGNAQISTTQSKYGGASMYFDGTGDDLRVVNAGVTTGFGTGDFTVEFWVYANSWSTFNNLVDFRKVNDYFMIAYTSGAIQFYNNGSYRITGGSLSTTTWYHIAVCRSGTSTKMFVNGTQAGSTYTDSSNYPIETVITIGARNDDVGNPFNGYIDDLRITKGVARYTANFTPPTAAFPTN